MIIYNSNTINGLNYGSTDFGQIYYHNKVCYQKVKTLKNYFRFVSLADGNRFSNSISTTEYSLDSGSTWVTLQPNTYSPYINSGETIYWKGNLTSPSQDNGIGTFYASGSFDVEGNIMSLLYGDNFEGETTMSNGHFYYLFLGNSYLRSASGLTLPSTTLADDCYKSMFFNCTSLVAAPELPATSLADGCYAYMFRGCSSLVTAPELHVATLQSDCYRYMFVGCTSLNSITCLATDISALGCTNNWLGSVASSGTFYKDPNMNDWTSGRNGIPEGWTIEDY